MRINYIPVFYFGSRRGRNPENKYDFLREHLNFISKLNSDSPICATIIVNKSENQNEENEVNSIMSEYLYNVPIEIAFRKNIGYSYGAWDFAVQANMPHNYDYSFLIEDDYIPTHEKFYEPFLEKMDNNTAYVCVKVFDNPRHAAISNGMIGGEQVNRVMSSKGKLFQINTDSSYNSAENSQREFLNYLTSMGMDIKDIDDSYSKPYLHINEVIEYGGTLKAPLRPIV